LATVTILADHKGYARPRVSGDEYFVDATIDLDPHLAAGVEITASSLGLSTITAVHITGVEKFDTFLPQVLLNASDGSYESSSSFKLVATDLDGSNASASNADDIGMVRIRAYGNI
tara:strand:+ start:240 stop:587 length:348 start_codon:yes stop_codon:yes gene_type:complete